MLDGNTYNRITNVWTRCLMRLRWLL